MIRTIALLGDAAQSEVSRLAGHVEAAPARRAAILR
jgi:hypothetical protein